MSWPWMSKAHHVAVLAVKDEMIRLLQDQNATLARRMLVPMDISVKLPEDFAVAMPAVVKRRKPSDQPQEQRASQAPIDYANVDENDLAALSRIAAQELGTTVAPNVLARTIAQIKMTIRSAKREKLERNLKEARQVHTQASPVEADDDASGVPKEVRDAVAAAERGY